MGLVGLHKKGERELTRSYLFLAWVMLSAAIVVGFIRFVRAYEAGQFDTKIEEEQS